MLDLLREIHRRSVWQVIGIYLATSWGVLNVVDVLTGFAGLPDWTPTMAVVLLLIGFPIVTATAVIQGGMSGAGLTEEGASEVAGSSPDTGEGAPESEAPAVPSEPQLGAAPPSAADGLSRLFTWRNALLGGAAAGLLLLVSGGAYLAMWSMGIGPVGSLVAQGVLEERDPILLVDFEDGDSEADLGASVTQALAVDLSSSTVVSLLSDDAIAENLRLMGREAGTELDVELAREVALRANVKAYLSGEVSQIGSRYLIVARIVNPQTGEDLVSFREEAAGDDDLLPAIDRLSQRLREKLGESLRDIRLGAPLEQATTSSFEALRKLTQAERAEEAGDYALAERLVTESIELDPDFAMGYRKLSVLRFNLGLDNASDVATRAYELRDRLTDRERYLTEGNYHTNVTFDDRAALEAYAALLEQWPNDAAALNNGSNILRRLTRFDEASAYLERAVAEGGSSVAAFNRVRINLAQGNAEGTVEAVEAYRTQFPGHIYQPWADLLETVAVGEWDGVHARLERLRAEGDILFLAEQAPRFGAAAAIRTGALARAEAWIEQIDDGLNDFVHAGTFLFTIGEPELRLWILDDTAGAMDALEEGLGAWPRGADRNRQPWPEAVHLAVVGERPDLARQVLEAWAASLPDAPSANQVARREASDAMLDAAEGRLDEGLARIQAASRSIECPRCFEVQEAYMLERLDRRAEAVAIWEAVRDRPVNLEGRGFDYIVALKKLAPLYESVGDPTNAAAAYRALAEAWATADPELRPQARAAEQRANGLDG